MAEGAREADTIPACPRGGERARATIGSGGGRDRAHEACALRARRWKEAAEGGSTPVEAGSGGKAPQFRTRKQDEGRGVGQQE